MINLIIVAEFEYFRKWIDNCLHLFLFCAVCIVSCGLHVTDGTKVSYFFFLILGICQRCFDISIEETRDI